MGLRHRPRRRVGIRSGGYYFIIYLFLAIFCFLVFAPWLVFLGRIIAAVMRTIARAPRGRRRTVGAYISPPSWKTMRALLSPSPLLESLAFALWLFARVFGCSLSAAGIPVFAELFACWFLLCCSCFYFIFVHL